MSNKNRNINRELQRARRKQLIKHWASLEKMDREIMACDIKIELKRLAQRKPARGMR
jgi:ribosomal protein RSM22 (predicted rRNA methylase)